MAVLGESVMQWFRSKGIENGDPNSLSDAFHDIQLKKVLSQKETHSNSPSSLLTRRLKAKLTLV